MGTSSCTLLLGLLETYLSASLHETAMWETSSETYPLNPSALLSSRHTLLVITQFFHCFTALRFGIKSGSSSESENQHLAILLKIFTDISTVCESPTQTPSSALTSSLSFQLFSLLVVSSVLAATFEPCFHISVARTSLRLFTRVQ